MTSYTVNCGVSATDNDYFKLAELRVSEAKVPELLAGIRGLLGGQLEVLYLTDEKQKAAICAVEDNDGLPVFLLRFATNRSQFYIHELQLGEIECFLLDRLFGGKKPSSSVCVQLESTDDSLTQLSLSCWVGQKG